MRYTASDSILQPLPWPCFIFSKHGKIKWANQAFEKMSGHPVKEINLKESIEPAFGAPRQDIFTDFLKSGKATLTTAFNFLINKQESALRQSGTVMHGKLLSQTGLYCRASLSRHGREEGFCALEPFPERIDALLARYTEIPFAVIDDDSKILEANDYFFNLAVGWEAKEKIKSAPLSAFLEKQGWHDFETASERWRLHLLAIKKGRKNPWKEQVRSFCENGRAEEWKALDSGAWKVTGRDLCFDSRDKGLSAILLNRPVTRAGDDFRASFTLEAIDPEGCGLFIHGATVFRETPDESGLSLIIHDNSLFLKQYCYPAAIVPLPENAGKRLCVVFEKIGGMAQVWINNVLLLKTFDLSPVFHQQEGHIGFFAGAKARFTDFELSTGPSEADLNLLPAAAFDVRFNKRPGNIFQMRVVRRMQGEKTLRGAVFTDVTTLREQEKALLESRQALETMARENTSLKEGLEADQRWVEGKSRTMARIHAIVREIAPTRAGVLIQGETGTGKEVLARFIHQSSPRAGKPFVKVDCAALPETLLESELFGHEKGAFTGAAEQRIGRFELAHGGTLFLDEIGNLNLSIQAKLLRVLQDLAFERIGSAETVFSDFRLICATNSDLEGLIREGRFRKDLFFRINAIKLTLPPLRERAADIPLFIHKFMAEGAEKNSRALPNITRQALELLESHPWPGNIRELRNVVETAVILAEKGEIDAANVKPLLSSGKAAHISDAQVLSQPGRLQIVPALRKMRGNVKKTAEYLGLRPARLYYLLKIWNIRPKKG